MERITASSIFMTVVCIIVVKGFMKLVNWAWLRPKRLEKLLRKQGISGTPYKFLIGNVIEFSSMRNEALNNPMSAFSHDYFQRVEPFRHHLATKFGNEFFIWFGPIPMLSITKPELIRQYLTNIKEFGKVKMDPIIEKLLPGIFTSEGEIWAKNRKIINPAFHADKLMLLLPAFRDSCKEIINKWEIVVAETGSGELDMWPDLMKLTADVISRAAFSIDYEEGRTIIELLKEQSELTLQMLHSVNFPGLRSIPTARNMRFKAIEDQLHASLHAIISKRQEKIDGGETIKVDLLSMVMDSNLKEIQRDNSNNNKRKLGMTLEEMIDECKLFYLAGKETTSSLLVWTLILLSKHQDWQARAREEVLKLFGNNIPSFEGLNYLKTVTMILYEVLRLYPPTIQIARWVHKDTKLGELSFPSGLIINFFVNSLHREEEFWGEDAQEFKPERFAEGVLKATKGNNSFLPFGWGPRKCVGERFAMTEAKMALSMILQRFSFELSPSYIHALENHTFLRPQHGAQIILHKL